MSTVGFGKMGGPIGNPQSLSAPISHAALNENIVIAAVSGKRIAVLGVMITSTGIVAATWRNGASGVDFSGGNNLTAQDGYVLPIGNPESYWMITDVGNALVLNLSAAIPVDGIVSYRLID